MEKRLHYYGGFDYLRVLFCAAVVAWHVKIFGLTSSFDKANFMIQKINLVDIIYFNIFQLGVPMFIMIALYLYACNRKKKEKYFLKRISYLIVLYLFWTFASSVFTMGNFDLQYFKRWDFILRGGYSHIYFIFSLISLTIVEEILFRIKNITNNKIFIFFIIVLLAMSIIEILFRSSLGSYFSNSPYVSLIMAYYSPLNFLPYVFISILIYECIENNIKIFNYKVLIGAFVLLIIIIVAEWSLLPQEINFPFEGVCIPTYGRLSVILSVVLLLLVVINKEINPPNMIKQLSKLTLGIYLIHYLLMLKFHVIWPSLNNYLAQHRIQYFVVIFLFSSVITHLLKNRKVI